MSEHRKCAITTFLPSRNLISTAHDLNAILYCMFNIQNEVQGWSKLNYYLTANINKLLIEAAVSHKIVSFVAKKFVLTYNYYHILFI